MPRRLLEIVGEASAARSRSSVRRPDESEESRWFTWKKTSAASAFSLVGFGTLAFTHDVILHGDSVKQRGPFPAAARRD